MVRKVIVKEAKVKRVETNLKAKKVLTKAELEIQLKNLLEINDTLEKTNVKNMKIIVSFEDKIQSLEEQIQSLGKYNERYSSPEVLISKQTQTETDLKLKCEECNFEGANEREFGWHMGKYHGWPGNEKSEEMDISNSEWGWIL